MIKDVNHSIIQEVIDSMVRSIGFNILSLTSEIETFAKISIFEVGTYMKNGEIVMRVWKGKNQKQLKYSKKMIQSSTSFLSLLRTDVQNIVAKLLEE